MARPERPLRQKRRAATGALTGAALVVGALLGSAGVAAADPDTGATSVDDTDPGIGYSGPWDTSTGAAKFEGDDHYTATAGASAQLSFTGSSIVVFGAQAPWHGQMSVSVDGGPDTIVSTYRASRADQVRLFVRSGLGAGGHTVTITAVGDGTIALDRIDIDAPPAPSDPPTTDNPSAAGKQQATLDDDDQVIAYAGSWQTSSGSQKFGGGDHFSSTAGDTVTVRFAGTGIAVFGAQAPWHGLATFSVDDGGEQQVDLFASARADRQQIYAVSGLSGSTHTLRIEVAGQHDATSSGDVVALDEMVITSTSTSPTNSSSAGTAPPAAKSTPTPVTAPTRSGFVTRSGKQLMLGGKIFRFAGTNEYYLGLDDNIRDAAGNPTYPTKFRVDSALTSAADTGATVVRSHSIGISVGCSVCLEPTRGQFNDSALSAADYAIYRAGQLGLKMVVPLTDQWRYYHGGESVFVGWRGYPVAPDRSRTAANDVAEKAAEANFYTDPTVVSDFQTYVAHLLNHTNPYTGLAYKNDPTIMAWETGNEIWTATPAWTEQIASFIKHTLGAQQLVADGTAATGMHVSRAALDAPDIDIVGGHFYPIDTAWMIGDAAAAAAHGKAYMVGEFDWTNAAATVALERAVQDSPDIAGDLYWTLMPKMENNVVEPHDDGYAISSSATGSAARILATLVRHAKTMSAAG